MGSFGPALLITLLLAVAVVAATGGFIASSLARRNRRRDRGFFLMGFFCGFIAGPILRRRRRSATSLGAVALAGVRPRVARICRDTGHFAVDALTLAASHVQQSISTRRRAGRWVHGR
jgi:hypothetical protein